MEEEFKKVFSVLNNFLEIVGNNNGIIDENLLKNHPEIFFSLLRRISISIKKEIYTSYFYDQISDGIYIIEYLKLKGINLSEQDYDKFEIKYESMLNNIEEQLENIQVNKESVMSFLSKLFSDVGKLKELINNTNSDIALKFLFIQYLKNIDLNKITDEIIQLFIQKIGKLELLSLLKKESSVNDNYLLRKLYNNFELSHEEIQDLIDKDLLIGIEYFKNITQLLSDNNVIKKLLVKQYWNIIGLISEEQFIDNYSLIEPLLSNNMYEILTSCSCLKILSNGEIFDKVYNHIDNSYYIDLFLKILPNDYSDKIRITKCLLNCSDTDEFNGVEKNNDEWISNIDLALKNGYRCNKLTRISTVEEVEVFIKNEQYQIINYVDKNILNYEMVNNCVSNGIEPKIDYNYSSFVLKKYISEHENTKIVSNLKTWLYFFPNLQYEFMNEDIIEKSFNDNGPTNFFLNKVLFDKKFFFMISKEKNFIDNNNTLNENIIQYINFINNSSELIPFINEIEDIEIYFDEFGPTEKLYEKVFSCKELFYSLFENNDKYLKDLKDKLNCFDYVIKYLKFVKENSLFNIMSNYIHNIDDIKEYYNGLGPTEKLYRLALFESLLFDKLFRDQRYIKVCNFSKNIDNYIKFIKSNKYASSYIKSIDDINNYFDDNGVTKELYQKGLFDKNLFDNMYNNYNYKNICNYSKEIENYIHFIKENNIMFDFIRTVSDIKKYFNSVGPNQLLFEMGLTNISLFRDLYRKNTYKNYCKFSNGVEYYISFIKKYGIMFKFISSVSDIEKYFDKNGATDYLKNYFKVNKELSSSIIYSATHNNQIITNLSKDFVDIFEYYIIDNYFSNCINPKEKYDYLLKNIGTSIIFNLDSDKIKRFIEIDISQLDKFFKVVYSSKINSLTPELAYNNLMQSIIRFNFEKENSDVINIFTNVNSLLIHMNDIEFEKYLEGNTIGELSSKLNYYIMQIISILNITEQEEIEKIKNAIKECKINLKEDELRKYCRKYVKRCREIYTLENKNKIFEDLKIPQSFVREDAIKKMSAYFAKEITYRDFWIYMEKFKDKIPENEYKMLETITLDEFNLIINRGKKPDPSIVKKIKPFNMLLNEYSKYEFDNNNNNNLLLQMLNVEKKYYIKLHDIDIIKIITELDIDIYLNTIGKDDKLLNSLSKLFQNFYLGKLPENISSFFCDEYELGKKLPGGINNIGTFITRYYQILLDKKRRLEMQNSSSYELDKIAFTFSDIVKLISIVNTETIEIRRLIGTEEYSDFVSNESPNSNSYDRLSRENKLVPLLDFLYTNNKITIPAKDIIISNKNNSKEINFIVGNRTNSSNICHGERTGACMRIGGVGEGFFLKCLTDKNWFHIRLEDPNTHKYISRVSGFRNGNSVYLNQLRESSDSLKYTKEDLQEFIRIYARSLIEETKDSEYPIENVFINNNYAMDTDNSKKYILGAGIQSEYNLDDVKEYRLKVTNDIWTDVKNNAILLATTDEGKKTLEGYAPLKNGPDDAIEYDVARDKIYGINYDENIILHHFVQIDVNDVYEKINRVHCMKQKLLGYDYKYIDDITTETIIDAYVSSDWYVYIDSNYEIHSDFISEIKNADEIVPYGSVLFAQQEMEKYRQILINKYNISQKNEVKHAI